MKYLKVISLFVVLSSFVPSIVSAQAWKSAEQKQAINRQADAQKRIINNENALKRNRDEVSKAIFKDRIALLKTIASDIEKWNAKINAGDKINSQRYNLITQIKLRKSEAIQMLLTLRTMEIAYKNFGGEYKDEPMDILQKLRTKTEQATQAFDDSIQELINKIQ